VEDDKLVLYGGHRLLVMGAYATEVWHLCNGERSLEEIIDAIVSEYNVPKEKVSQEITIFINQFVEKKLIILLKSGE
jgi:hypothetical protein